MVIPVGTTRSTRFPGHVKPVHTLAVLGGIYTFFEIWTVSGWLADGPRQITQFRNPDAASWWGARIFEGLAVMMAIVMLIYLVRSCRREARWTFDALFCISGLLLYWADPYANWAQPIFYYNTNWVNLANWCGHTPFVVNPDCGKFPEPVLFLSLVYTFGFLIFAMWVGSFVRWIEQRRGPASKLQKLAWIFVAICIVDVLLEVPIICLGLWDYPAYPLSLTGGGSHNFPLSELLGAAIAMGSLAALRLFKDDRGLTVAERGLEHVHSSFVRSSLTVLAILGVAVSAWIVGNSADIIMGPYLTPFPRLAPEIVNDMCDAPGITGTAYGPCPGSPVYKAPIRRLLPEARS